MSLPSPPESVPSMTAAGAIHPVCHLGIGDKRLHSRTGNVMIGGGHGCPCIICDIVRSEVFISAPTEKVARCMHPAISPLPVIVCSGQLRE